MTKNLPAISVVIPTWNRKDDCLNCLRSVFSLDYPSKKLEVVVVDNASTDGTAEAVRKEFPSVHIIRMIKNRGFAGAVNEVVRTSNREFILILDNDVIVDKQALKELVKTMKADYKVGFAAGKVYDFKKKNSFQILFGKIDPVTFHVNKIGVGEVDKGQYDIQLTTDFVSIGSGLARRLMLEKVGFLDERYFIYFEDTDLFTVCKRAGFKIVYVPKARAWHKGSTSLGKDNAKILYYLARNNLLIRKKFNGLSLIDHLRHLRFFLGLLIFYLLTRKKEYHAVFRGIIDFYCGRFGEAPATI